MSENEPSAAALEFAQRELRIEEHGYIFLDSPMVNNEISPGVMVSIDCENTPEHFYDGMARLLDAYAAAFAESERNHLTYIHQLERDSAIDEAVAAERARIVERLKAKKGRWDNAALAGDWSIDFAEGAEVANADAIRLIEHMAQEDMS